MTRYVSVAIALVASILANAAEANDQFTVVLHARTPAGAGSCTEADVPNCQTIRPTTQVAAGADFRLYVFVNNYNDIQGLQTSFDWPADWIVDPDGEFPIIHGCRSGIFCGDDGPGNPVPRTLACAFDCVMGPQLTAIARIDFQSGASGCLIQVNPT